MNLQHTMTTTAAATPALADEIQDFDLPRSGMVVPMQPKTSPESATVADSKPLDGEVIPPTKGRKKIADNDAQFASVADRIRARQRRGVLMLVENGRDLITVKEKMGHGLFGEWLKREFGWSERSAQNYMNAVRAFDELEGRGCVPEAIAFLPLTMLYDFDKQSDADKEKCVKAVKSGTLKAVQGMKTKKAATSKTTSIPAAAPTGKDHGAAEALAKLIAGKLLASFKMQIGSHAGFASPVFGEILQKECARSFGADSSGKADRRKRMEEVADFLPLLKEAVEEIRSEQEEAFENMPESFQGSEKGETAQEIMDALQSATDSMEEAGDSLSNAMDL
ncbi:DUF3102 domain-containing protein [Mesorhizobium sp. A623]